MPFRLSGTLFCVVIAITQIACAAEPVDWENPSVIGRNKEEPVASFFRFTERSDALLGKSPPSVRSLHGPWKFSWSRAHLA